MTFDPTVSEHAKKKETPQNVRTELRSLFFSLSGDIILHQNIAL